MIPNLIVILTVLIPPLLYAFPNGAPPGTCTSLTPGHGQASQNLSTSPYKVTLDKAKVKPGGNVKITLSTVSSPGFKGFIAQGRKAGGGGTTPFGKFVLAPGDKDSKTLKCSHDAASVTHSSSGIKKSATWTWVAPREKGKHKILVTVVQSFNTFWVAQPSAAIEVN